MFSIFLEAKGGEDGLEIIKKLFTGVTGRELNIKEVNVQNVGQFGIRVSLGGQGVFGQAWSGFRIKIERALLRCMVRSKAG